MTLLHAVALLLLLVFSSPAHAESLAEINARVGEATAKAFAGCVYLDQSRDYFARFSRDTDATPTENDTVLDGTWQIVIASDADPLVARMATDLADFLARRMALSLPLETLSPEAVARPPVHSIALVDHGGGTPEVAESFTLRVAADQIVLQGVDARGVRDGVVQLVDRMGLRAAPFLARGEETCVPRLPVRLGPMPSGGSYRETAFLGYNAVLSGGGSLHALSRSNANPKLDGAVIIIGGEGFYHCFMRPFDVKKGHTNCARCEALGADRVVANLCNRMARQWILPLHGRDFRRRRRPEATDVFHQAHRRGAALHALLPDDGGPSA
jgi:hypothetical protein